LLTGVRDVLIHQRTVGNFIKFLPALIMDAGKTQCLMVKHLKVVMGNLITHMVFLDVASQKEG